MFKKNKVYPSYFYYENDNSKPTKVKHKYLNRSNLNKLPRLSTNSRLEPLRKNVSILNEYIHQNTYTL